MSNFGQMQADMQLLGMASLLNADFGSLINKVQREEVESYPWSFLFTTVTIFSAPPATAGFILTINQGATIINTGIGTNFGANSGFSIPTALNNVFYLWVGPTMTTPVPVSIVSSATSLALATPWAQPTLTNASYSLQPLYYRIDPLQTVLRVRQIDDLIQTSQEELARLDPSRIATGGAPSLRWAMAPFLQSPLSRQQSSSGTGTNSSGPGTVNTNVPMVELWPRPSSVLPYAIDGKIGPVDMVALTDLPMIPSQVLESKAMMYAARAVFASNGNPKWLSISEAYRQDYLVELEKAKHEDSKRITPKGITSWGGRRLFDASIDVTHDLDGPPDYHAG